MSLQSAESTHRFRGASKQNKNKNAIKIKDKAVKNKYQKS